MTEEQQAELLAAWLADPEAPIPEGLDPDVVETVLALHPERAPAPRVTAESILDLVETGPLAPTVVEPPAIPEPANRGWWRLALLGSSGLVAAALALVVVGVGVVGSNLTLDREAPVGAMSEEGVVAAPGLDADTGMADGRLARRPSPKPAARPLSSPAPAPLAARQLAKKPIAEAAPAEAEPTEPDAVAFAEEEDAEDFVDGIQAEPSVTLDLDADAAAGPKGGGGRGVAAGEPLDQPAATPSTGGLAQQAPAQSTTAGLDDLQAEKSARLAEDSYRDEDDAKRVEEERRRQAEESRRYDASREAEESARRSAESERKAAEQAEARREAEASARRAAESAAMRAKEEAQLQAASAEANKAKKSRAARPRPAPSPRPARAPAADAMEPIPEAAGAPVEAQAPAAPSAPPPPPSDPDLRAARDFLAVGDPTSALNAIARGLKRNRSDSWIRQQLFQVQGDAYTALGQAGPAAEAYREAQAIGARL